MFFVHDTIIFPIEDMALCYSYQAPIVGKYFTNEYITQYKLKLKSGWDMDLTKEQFDSIQHGMKEIRASEFYLEEYKNKRIGQVE